jgi:hypothetical protein
MQNREEIRQNGTTGVEKQHFVRGEKISFRKGEEGINTVSRPKYSILWERNEGGA